MVLNTVTAQEIFIIEQGTRRMEIWCASKEFGIDAMCRLWSLNQNIDYRRANFVSWCCSLGGATPQTSFCSFWLNGCWAIAQIVLYACPTLGGANMKGHTHPRTQQFISIVLDNTATVNMKCLIPLHYILTGILGYKWKGKIKFNKLIKCFHFLTG